MKPRLDAAHESRGSAYPVPRNSVPQNRVKALTLSPRTGLDDLLMNWRIRLRPDGLSLNPVPRNTVPRGNLPCPPEQGN
jgi:hypothetical protein